MKRRGFLLTGMVMSAVALAALIAPAQSQDPAPEVTPEATAEPTPFTLVLAKDGVCYVTPDESAVIIPGDGVYNLPDASLRFSLKATHVSPPIAYAAITPDSSKAYVPLDGLYDLTTGERLLDVAVSSGWIDTEGRYLELYDYDLRYYTLYDLTTMQEIPRAEADAIRDARAAASVPHPYSQTMDIYDPEKGEIRMTFSEDLSLYAAVTPTTLGVYTLPDRTKLFEAGLPYTPHTPDSFSYLTDIHFINDDLVVLTQVGGLIASGPVDVDGESPLQPTPPSRDTFTHGATTAYRVSDGELLYTLDDAANFPLEGDWFTLPDGLYDVYTGQRRFKFETIKSAMGNVNPSPDGSLILRQDDGMYDFATGERLYSIPSYVIHLFSPDSRWLWIRRVGVLDARTGRNHLPMTGGGSVRFSADSHYAAWNRSSTCHLYAAPDF